MEAMEWEQSNSVTRCSFPSPFPIPLPPFLCQFRGSKFIHPPRRLRSPIPLRPLTFAPCLLPPDSCPHIPARCLPAPPPLLSSPGASPYSRDIF